eukprot:1852725-Alexandrium_andersonii.AAC.1
MALELHRVDERQVEAEAEAEQNREEHRADHRACVFQQALRALGAAGRPRTQARPPKQHLGLGSLGASAAGQEWHSHAANRLED